MKKSNYLTYLKEYHHKLPQGIEKQFKIMKDKFIPTFQKSSKSKSLKANPQKYLAKAINKKNENKENIHPNFEQYICSQNLLNKNNRKLEVMGNKSINHIIRNQTQKCQNKIQLKIKLNQCNFQPSHNSQKLYLVCLEGQKQFIVCEKCSLRFDSHILISSLYQSKQSLSYSYVDLVAKYEQIKKSKKKIQQIKQIEKQNIKQTVKKVERYYKQLIKILLQTQIEVEKQIFYIYEKNSELLQNNINCHQKQLQILQQTIQKLQRSCKSQNHINNKFDQKQIDQIFRASDETKQKTIQLLQIHIEIPQHSEDKFLTQFNKSQFCLYLFKDILDQKMNQSKKKSLNESQRSSINNECESIQNQKSENLIQDFQKEIPFIVQYTNSPSQKNKQSNLKIQLTQQSNSKNYNFSNALIDQQLNNISSSEQLLIDSIRNMEIQQKQQEKMYKRLNEKIEEKLSMNFKTQSSTKRQLDQESYNKNNTKNQKEFIKKLHCCLNQYEDLMCDEELTLSNSHPIHETKLIYPSKNNSIMQRKNNKNIQKSLALSQFQSMKNESKIRNNDSYIENQTQKCSSLILQGSSLLNNHNNKHEISFQIDDNLMIDNNILSSQENQSENFDIISPAFKII